MLTKVLYSVNALCKKQTSWVTDALLIAIGSCLISLAAPLSFRLPFTPVAITVAHCVCLVLGVVLGRRRGALAVLSYLLQGGMGLPVFAAGSAGWLYLLGPTGGYYLGWLAAAYLAGYLVEKTEKRTAFKYFLALAAGNGLIYLFGLPHLALFVGWKSAFALGFSPFILMDLIKLLLIAPLLAKRNVA